MTEIFGELESPKNGEMIDRQLIFVKGWVFCEPDSDLDFDIYLDGKLLEIPVKWFLARNDIFKKYGTETAYESGFLANVRIQDSKKNHYFKLVAKTSTNEKTLGEVNLESSATNDSKKYWGSALPAGIGPKSHREKEKRQIINLGRLKPENNVLEIGSGLGRKSVLLSKYLNSSSEYYGLEPVQFAVEYCKNNITTRFPNFHFQVVDVYNGFYNPAGKQNASEYQFPYGDEKFDFVLLTSISTHIIPADLINYLHEIKRVLKKGGRCLNTFFLLSKNNQKTYSERKNFFKFKKDDFWTVDDKVPEKAIAYEEVSIRKFYRSAGLTIEEPIHYSALGDPSTIYKGQDVVIAVKR